MTVTIRNNAGEPIYAQITSQIKAAILSGELAEGDALPSMRLLAKELRVSLITTRRAYEELEREGFAVSVPGKGSFVTAMDPALVREEHLRRIEGLLREAASLAKTGGVTTKELSQLLSLVCEEDEA